jgi:DNA-binding NtrC family response regulator
MYTSASWIPPLYFGADVPPPGFDKSKNIHDPSSRERKQRVLVVDDERLIADTLCEILNDAGFEAITAYDGKTALQQLDRWCPDILISDVMMPGPNGVEIAKMTAERCPGARVLLLSGQAATKDILERARKEGFDFELLAKPLHPAILLKKLG